MLQLRGLFLICKRVAFREVVDGFVFRPVPILSGLYLLSYVSFLQSIFKIHSIISDGFAHLSFIVVFKL